MTTAHLIDDLELDEGRRSRPYLDSRGFWTVGVGHNVSADPAMLAQLPALKRDGLGDDAIEALLADDVAKVEARLDADLPWWRGLDDVRQDVMVNLALNLGEGKFATWRHTLADIQAGRFKAAEVDLLNDEPWASQVHARARRLAYQMQTGLRAWSATAAEIEAVLAGAAAPAAAEPPAAPPEPAPVDAPQESTIDPATAAPRDSGAVQIPSLWREMRNHLAAAGGVAATALTALLAFAQAHPFTFVLLLLAAATMGAASLWLISHLAHQHRETVKTALASPPPGSASPLTPAQLALLKQLLAAAKAAAAPG